MAVNTNINFPQSPFLDALTGRPAREWMVWLQYPQVVSINLANALGPSSGGTGTSAIPKNGQTLIGNGTTYTVAYLTPDLGIGITNGSGSITIKNTGVLSNIAGTGISVSSATGNVTVANTGVLSWSAGTTGLLPSTATNGAVTLSGLLNIATGGTNSTATPTAYGISYGTGTAYAFTAAGTDKQVLKANTGAAPTWTTLTTGTSILYGDNTGGFSNVTIGSGVSFVGGTLSATGSGGTVTSVTGTAPVVSSGGTAPAISLAANYGDTLNPYAAKTANYVLAGPASGAAAVPGFRALVAADIPSLPYGTGTVTSVAALTLGTTGTDLSSTIANGTTTPVITLNVPTASATNRGALSSSDWTTFNNKGSGTVTSVTGTAPVVSSGGTTPAISMAAATASVNGYLTSADWSTFNGKQPAGAYLTAVTSDSPLTGAGTAASHLSMPAATTSVSGYLTSTDWTTFNNKGSGTVTSVSFTGGIISVATGTTTPAFTVAGTSGGIPYFASGTTWASSAALTQYGVVYGGGAGAAPVATAAGTTGQVLTATTSGAPTWANPATNGTVTSVSVVSANGFAGTVATSTTTPAITLTTSITGLLKGNGTAISAAVANTDYVPLSTVLTKTADYTITNTDTWIINNKPSTALTLTFPAASSWTGRSITVKNMQAQLVNSASSNIVPIDSTTAGTAILLGVIGNWATMVSDGTNWVIMQAASNNNLLLE